MPPSKRTDPEPTDTDNNAPATPRRRRAAVAELAVSGPADGPTCAILTVVVRHLTPAVRPDDVLAALRGIADLVPPSPPQVTRLAQGLLADDGRLEDPLDPDRVASEPGPE